MSIFVPPRLRKEYLKERKAHPTLSHETVMQIAKDHMSYSACPPDLAWESKQGVKEYIQSETRRQGPYYALVTGALHGAPVNYSDTQPFVEKIVEEGPEAWLDVDKVRKFLRSRISGKSYLFWKERAPVLVEVSKCFLENRENPLACTAPGRIKGIGLKGSQLMREYLGDDNAVAVDRHVFGYVCKHRPEWCKKVMPRIQLQKGKITIPEDVQKEAADHVRYMAFECGKTPADIQTAAWLKGACEGALKHAKRPSDAVVWLGPEKKIYCAKKSIEAPRKALERRPPPERGTTHLLRTMKRKMPPQEPLEGYKLLF